MRPIRPVKKTFHSGIEVGNEVAAELAAGVGQPLWIAAGDGHQQQAYALATGAGDGDAAGVDFALLAGDAMEIVNSGGAVFFGDDDLADHRVGEDGELAGLHGRVQVDVGGVVFGGYVAAGHAVSAVVAGGTGLGRAGERGFAGLDDGDAEFFGSALEKEVS